MSRFARSATLAYGVGCYSLFFVTFLYLIGWLTNLVVPVSIDSGAPGSALASFAIDAALIVLFGLQHSVMARPAFKRWLLRFVPQPIERATYVLASTAVFLLTFALWQPLPAELWRAEGALAAVLQTGALLGFAMVLYTTFLIDHFDLFGLRQVFLAWSGRAYTEKRFVTPQLYRFIRHPLYVGWTVAFWSAPVMTVGHALFAAGMTAYIGIAIRYEERDLETALGEPYRRWRAKTPMFVPRIRAPRRPASARAAEAS